MKLNKLVITIVALAFTSFGFASETNHALEAQAETNHMTLNIVLPVAIYCSAIDADQRVFSGSASTRGAAASRAMNKCYRGTHSPGTCRILNCK